MSVNACTMLINCIYVYITSLHEHGHSKMYISDGAEADGGDGLADLPAKLEGRLLHLRVQLIVYARVK